MRSSSAFPLQEILDPIENIVGDWAPGDRRPVSVYILERAGRLQFSFSWDRTLILEYEIEELSRLPYSEVMPLEIGSDKLIACVTQRLLEVCKGDRHGEIIITPRRGARPYDGKISFSIAVRTTHLP